MDELQGDGFGKGRRQDEEETDDAKGSGQPREADDLGRDGGDGAPEGAAGGAGEEGEGQQDGVGLCGDPDGQAEQAAEECHDGGHVDPAEGVAVVAYDGTADSETQVEDGADHGALCRCQVDGCGVVGQRVEQDDVAQFCDKAPEDDEDDLDAFAFADGEGSVRGVDRFVPVLEQDGAD